MVFGTEWTEFFRKLTEWVFGFFNKKHRGGNFILVIIIKIILLIHSDNSVHSV